jgi:hypothetical protein
MEVIDVSDWEEFERRLNEIRQTELSAGRNADFLFRGLPDSGWTLATTLEQSGQKGMCIGAYYHVIHSIKPQIESFTDRKWDIRNFPEVDRLTREYETVALRQFPNAKEYSYMAYLRHHGFPSPLLDWTRSPYVASYFAFRSRTTPTSGKVSLYVLSETPEGLKRTPNGKPRIVRIGPYVTTHKRHFLQQSDYTICVMFDQEAGIWHFAEHETVFAECDPDQDILWKLTIPWVERVKLLKFLDAHNLNAFSLFDSEESLMETLAIRELDSQH